MTLSLIIPAYNEADRIGRTLEQYLAAFTTNVEFIVVLNGCRDQTLAVVERVAHSRPDVPLAIIELAAAGKGRAIRRGFERATGSLIGFVDADGATSPAEFDKLIAALPGVDGVIASRWLPGSTIVNRQSKLRDVVSHTFMVLVKILFQLPFRDTQCGAKVFRRTVIDRVRPWLSVDNMVFDVELLVRLTQLGATVREVPSVWVDQSSSALLGSTRKVVLSSVKMFATLVRVRWQTLVRRPTPVA